MKKTLIAILAAFSITSVAHASIQTLPLWHNSSTSISYPYVNADSIWAQSFTGTSSVLTNLFAGPIHVSSTTALNSFDGSIRIGNGSNPAYGVITWDPVFIGLNNVYNWTSNVERTNYILAPEVDDAGFNPWLKNDGGMNITVGDYAFTANGNTINITNNGGGAVTHAITLTNTTGDINTLTGATLDDGTGRIGVTPTRTTNTGSGPAAGIGNTATATSTCSAGKKVFGGGGSITGNANDAVIRDSYPASTNDAWVVVYEATLGLGSGGTMTVYAQCY